MKTVYFVVSNSDIVYASDNEDDADTTLNKIYEHRLEYMASKMGYTMDCLKDHAAAIDYATRMNYGNLYYFGEDIFPNNSIWLRGADVYTDNGNMFTRKQLQDAYKEYKHE